MGHLSRIKRPYSYTEYFTYRISLLSTGGQGVLIRIYTHLYTFVVREVAYVKPHVASPPRKMGGSFTSREEDGGVGTATRRIRERHW